MTLKGGPASQLDSKQQQREEPDADRHHGAACPGWPEAPVREYPWSGQRCLAWPSLSVSGSLWSGW